MKRIITIFFLLVFLLVPIKISAVSSSSKAATVINGDTGEIIYSENGQQRLPMASTTKIMTALLLCEKGDFDEEITVTADMLKVEGSSMGLLAGDRVSQHDLLYGMLLSSGNDAANVTAITLGGNVENFVKMMNDKATELGLKDTHFETPSGLDGDLHYTTSDELAKLTMYAMKNEAFALAAGAKYATLYYGNPPYKRTLSNHNKLLKIYDGAVGVKTGFTKKSGRCLVSAAKKYDKYVIAVTLNDPNDWDDHKNLLDYGFSQIEQSLYTPSSDKYFIPVIGSNKEFTEVYIEPFIINTLELGDVTSIVNLPKMIYAPAEKGEIIGSIIYKKGNLTLGNVEIKLNEDIKEIIKEKSFKDKIIYYIKLILYNI